MLQAASSGDACGGRSDGLVVCLRLDLAEGVASTLDFGDDVVAMAFQMKGWDRGSNTRPSGDRRGEIGDIAEGSAAQAFVGEFLETSVR
jgi:hypothetical protein